MCNIQSSDPRSVQVDRSARDWSAPSVQEGLSRPARQALREGLGTQGQARLAGACPPGACHPARGAEMEPCVPWSGWNTTSGPRAVVAGTTQAACRHSPVPSPRSSAQGVAQNGTQLMLRGRGSGSRGVGGRL